MRLSVLFALPFVLACAGVLSSPEGTNAGECADSADNDGDAAFDCDDSDCAGSPDCDEGSGDDTAEDDTDDGELAFTHSWPGDKFVLEITNGSGGYSLGLAQTDSEGYPGETCIGSGLCHDDVSETGIELDAYATKAVENESTTYSSDQGLTLVVIAEDGTCWTWGEDPDYYVEKLDCSEY